jgi:MFS family permease
MAGKESEVHHIEDDRIGRINTADYSDDKNGLHAAHTANTAELPALMAENISYGKTGIAGLASSPYILLASFLASMGGFSFGYDQGVISIINVMPQFIATYPRIGEDDPRSAFWKGLNTGLLQLGCFMGCFFMPWLCDKISRKWAITVMVVFFNVGGIIMTAAPNYETLAFGRWFGGLGTGTLGLAAPLYISEIAPPNLRGTLLVLESISIVSGVVISFFITYGTRHMEGEIAFRLPFGLQLVSSTILGVLIHCFPYSPRWLCLKGRNDDALKSLCRLRRLPESDERVQIEHAGIMAEIELQNAMQERAHPGKSGFMLEMALWGDLFKRKMWRRTIVGVGVAFFQQFSGINA